MSAVQTLFDNWNDRDDLDQVYRNGFLETKVYGYGGDEHTLELLSKFSADSDAPHSFRAAALLSDIMELWPMYYSDEEKYYALRTMLDHDIGELVVGDVIADGGKAHEDKKPKELSAVTKFYRRMPDEAYIKCLEFFKHFEAEDTFLGQSMKLADRLDFIAKLIKLEKKGLVGYVSNKANPSERDIKYADEIGSDNYVDVVARSYLQHFQDKCYDPRLVQIGVGFMRCALKTVGKRHEFFAWWPKNYPH